MLTLCYRRYAIGSICFYYDIYIVPRCEHTNSISTSFHVGCLANDMLIYGTSGHCSHLFNPLLCNANERSTGRCVWRTRVWKTLGEHNIHMEVYKCHV